MRKFSEGGAQGRYDRRMADIEKDYAKAAARKTGRAAEVAAAKRDQRIADAKDDLAKRTGADRTKTREAERNAEYNLTRTRRSGAAMPAVTKDTGPVGKITDTLGAITAPKSDIKPKSRREEFNEAFRAARKDPEAMKRGVFTFNGEKFSTKMAGEGRRATPPAAAKNNPPAAAKNNPPAAAAKAPAAATPAAAAAKNPPAAAAKNPPAAAAKAAPAAKRYETPAQAKARIAKLTGSAQRRENLAGMFGIDSVSNAKARAQLLAVREKEKARNAERAKGRTPLISGTDTNAFFQYGDAAAKSNAANKAKGGAVKKEKTMKYAKGGSTPPQPSAADRARSKKHLDELKKLKPTAAEGKVAASANRSEGGMKKGGMVMKKADKAGRALVKKSADTMGRAMVKKAGGGKCYASGGSVSSASKRADGCAIKGKTKGKMLARGGAAKMRGRDSYGGAEFKKGGSC
jgi:hypothetical protein